MSEDQPVSLSAQLKEAERELALREQFYPRWVGEGRRGYSKATAETRLAAMRAIVQTLKRLEQDERQRIQPTLFGD